jgi:predicted regulator of Ras-like GTPase activity (Roadblock/LC7/MglB family)
MKNPMRINSGLSIIPSQEEMIEEVLSRQFEKSQARLILLIDTSGQVVSFHGERGSIDLIALGALTAGDMAASEEIARLANVYQQNQMVIRQGTKMNTIIYEADRNLILLFMVPASIPVGWMCHLVRETASQIQEVLAKIEKHQSAQAFDGNHHQDIKDLVNNAFDKVWKD